MKKGKISMGRLQKGIDFIFGGIFMAVFSATNVWAIPIFINEFHYDNAGADTMEFIELAGPSGSLSGWSVVLYNGNGGSAYHTLDLTGEEIADQQEINGTFYGTFSYTFPSGGIQNGAPDGIALVDAGINVVQFLSYEGTLSAGDGPASGMTSTDVGVFEASGTPAGFSLQLVGTGLEYEDFVWSGPSQNTKDTINTDQTFSAGESTPVPEPSTLLLIGLGISLIFSIRKRWEK